jgi:chromosome segregation ATPase
MQQPVLTADTQSSLPNHLPAPRTVTPNHGGGGPTKMMTTLTMTNNSSYSIRSAPSWEDYDEGLYGAANRKAKQRQQAQQNQNQNQNQRVVQRAPAGSSSVDFDEDMPMDEMMGSLKNSKANHNNYNYNNTAAAAMTAKKSMTAASPTSTIPERGTPDVRLLVASNRIEASSVKSRPPIVNTLTNTTTNDDVSSLGGVEDQHSTTNGIGRILNALKHHNNTSSGTNQNQNQNHRPPALNAEERLLWDSIQKSIGAVRQEHLAKRRVLEHQLQDANIQLEESTAGEGELERHLAKTMTQLAKLQKKNGSEGRDSEPSTSSTSILKVRLAQLEQKVEQTQTELKEKEAEHESEVRAIQRVLADVTTEREDSEQVLLDKISMLTSHVEALEADKLVLEQEKSTLSAEKAFLKEQKSALSSEKSTLQDEKTCAEAEKLALQAAAAKSKSRAVEAAETLASTPSSSSSTSEESAARIKKLEEEAQALQSAVNNVKAEKTAAKRESDKKQRRIMNLERDLKVTKTQLKKLENNLSKASQDNKMATTTALELEQQVEESRKRNLALSQQLEEKEKQLKRVRRAPLAPPAPPTPPRQAASFDTSDSASSEEVETLQRSLADTVTSLENAKKIIASLENANGSLALDLRAKVKSKKEELQRVENESAERKRRLDSLAMELRELQRKQGNVDRAEKQSRAQLMRLKALSMHLQKSVSGLQSASVVHEISTSTGQPDASNVEQISEILSDTLMAIKTTLEMAEQCIDEFDDVSVAMTDVDMGSEVGRTLDAIIRNDREAASKDLKDELDQKKVAVRRLEDTMRKQSEEMKRLRAQLDKRTDGGETEQLRAEIRSLREQCATNMDVLAKKERELSVLRSSLKVDDNDAGYISDDGSEQEDEADSCMSPNLNGYGHADAEALATILSNGSALHLPTRSRETEALKNDLLKAAGEKEKACRDLQAERESLANAKMIISSLEKANKSMMEDLRSRLQDSNTAIQSLLDKSMDHEKISSSLRAEVDTLKKAKEEVEQNHESQMKKFKDKAKVYSLRIASKDRELNDLRQRTDTSSISSSEEKKEDVEESTE